MTQDERLALAAAARGICDVLLCTMISVVFAVFLVGAASVQTERSGPATTQGDSSSNRDATQMLIDMTRTGPLLIENFDSILESLPGKSSSLNNEMLADECERRFLSRGIWGVIDRGLLTEIVRDPRIQSLSWLAECNKRMLFDQPDVRSRQRESILLGVNEYLESASDPEVKRGILDAAYRTTFYESFVVPRDGADTIIDLFKKCVPNTAPVVHDFACSKLRFMGYVCRSRYDEILQFLVEEAPELRAQLTAPRLIGMDVDNMLGSTHEATYSEAQYLAIYKASPQELASMVQTRLKGGERVTDSLGYKALNRLIREACSANGDAASLLTADLVRKGIKVSDILYRVSLNAAKENSPAERQAAQRCLNQVLRAYEEMPDANWPKSEVRSRTDAFDAVREGVEESLRGQPESQARTYVDQKLAETAARLEAIEAKAATNK